MATKTTNYQLTKPAGGEAVDISAINGNMDIIDSALNGQNQRIQSIETTVEDTPNKVNKPTDNPNGINGQILRSNGDGTTIWENPASTEEIAEAVTNWLDKNVPKGQTVVVDATLSTSGAAADAKKTGNEIASLNSLVSGMLSGEGANKQYTEGDTTGYYRIKYGTTDEIQQVTPGTPTTFTCIKIPVEDWMYKLSFTLLSAVSDLSGNSIFYAFTDVNDAFISRAPVAAGAYDIIIPSNAKYIYFSFFGNTYCTGYTIYSEKIIKEQDLEEAISENITPLASQVTELATDIENIGNTLNPTGTVYDTGETSGYYRQNSSDNSVIEKRASTSWTCGKYDVESWMHKISFSVYSIQGFSNLTIFCAFADANDVFISKPPFAVGNYEVEIPSNAKYIYLSFYGSQYNSAYTIQPNALVYLSDLAPIEKAIERAGIEAFDDMSGVAFGTSLTYRAQTTGGYLQYLPELSGITFDNQGIGSSKILGNGGNLDMLAAIKAYASYSNKRVCLLEGFVNDWYGNGPLGTWKDTTETTVCGCVRSALNFMLSQNANLTIFLILDPYGRIYNNVDCSTSAVNGDNLTQYEYYEEIAKVAESLGIPVIKEYAGSQISENTPQYFIDNIHPNALGANQSAKFIWSRMKTYFPNAVS